jgi:GNAT superfamily N-acetyltransferase
MTEGSVIGTIRPAERRDIPALQAMQARSLRALATGIYAPQEVEAFLADIGTLEPVLIEDRTYWVVERRGRILASGGWSLRRPGYAGRDPSVAPLPPRPTIRSIFVDPDHARGGLGRAIMEQVEGEVAARGFGRVELSATLTAVPFYVALGYRVGRLTTFALAGGTLRFATLGMAKALPAMRRRAA